MALFDIVSSAYARIDAEDIAKKARERLQAQEIADQVRAKLQTQRQPTQPQVFPSPNGEQYGQSLDMANRRAEIQQNQPSDEWLKATNPLADAAFKTGRDLGVGVPLTAASGIPAMASTAMRQAGGVANVLGGLGKANPVLDAMRKANPAAMAGYQSQATSPLQDFSGVADKASGWLGQQAGKLQQAGNLPPIAENIVSSIASSPLTIAEISILGFPGTGAMDGVVKASEYAKSQGREPTFGDLFRFVPAETAKGIATKVLFGAATKVAPKIAKALGSTHPEQWAPVGAAAGMVGTDIASSLIQTGKMPDLGSLAASGVVGAGLSGLPAFSKNKGKLPSVPEEAPQVSKLVPGPAPKTYAFDHYSPKAELENLDPAFMGKGLPGSERRSQANAGDLGVQRTYLYKAGATPEKRFSLLEKYSNEVTGNILEPSDPMFKQLLDEGSQLATSKGHPAGAVDVRNEAFFKVAKEKGYDLVVLPDGNAVALTKVPLHEPTSKLIQRKDVAIITAADPGNKTLSPEENAKRNAALEADIKASGRSYEPQMGAYQGDNGIVNKAPGFIIKGINQADALALGAKYGQEGVITHLGNVRQDGTYNPGDLSKSARGDQITSPYWTERMVNGKMERFSSPIDMDQTLPTPQDAPGSTISPELSATSMVRPVSQPTPQPSTGQVPRARAVAADFERFGMPVPKDLQTPTPGQVPPVTPTPATDVSPEKAPVGTAFKPASKFYQDWFNVKQTVENLADWAHENGINIGRNLDPRLAIRLKGGSKQAADSVLASGAFKLDNTGTAIKTSEGFMPIIREHEKASTIKDRKLRIVVADQYLQDTRTVSDLTEGKATVQQIAEARQRLTDLQANSPQEFALLQKTGKRLYDFQTNVLHMLVDSGRISQETFDTIMSENKHFVPFDSVNTGVEANVPVRPDKTTMTPRKTLFRKGMSDQPVENVFESILKRTYRIVDSADSNIVTRSIGQFADLPGMENQIRTIRKPGEKEGVERPDQIDVSTKTLSNNQIVAYNEGVPTVYQLSDAMAQSFKAFDAKSVGIGRRLMMAGAGMLRTGATITPDFGIRNMTRDQGSALMQTKVRFIPFVDSARALADILGKSAVFQEYLDSGGGMQSYADLKRTKLQRTFEELRGHKTTLEKLNIITRMQDFSALLEQATRVGVYKAARRSGLGGRESVLVSRESTLDFDRAGEKGRRANETIAFLNAGIQSADKMARSMHADPVGFSAKALAYVTVPQILLFMLNKDDPEYKMIPRWQKDACYILPPIPGIGRVRIPKPFVIGQLYGSSVERFMEYAISKDKHALDGVLNMVFESMSPIGMDAAGSIIPTALKPLAETILNYNLFTQKAIYPEYTKALEPRDRYDKYTSETMKKVGDVINWSPAKLENIYAGLTGGLGRYALQGTDALVKLFSKNKVQTRPMELADVPVVKGFVTRHAGSVPETQSMFYDAADELDKVSAQYKKYVADQKPEEANKFFLKHPELQYRDDFVKYKRSISEVNKLIEEVIKSDLTSTDKRKRISEYEDFRNQMLDSILKEYSGKVRIFKIPPLLSRIVQ